ncbi:MAG: tetratricopeptide repeat protein [Planctomycetota bacterium]|jgi:tetratricopeptide (TPR) repeat protein
MHAEDAYLFRHALVRDAAYQMQLPAGRAVLHALAITCTLFQADTGCETETIQLDELADKPNTIDPFAIELANHARLALSESDLHDPPENSALHEQIRIFLHRSAVQLGRLYRHQEAMSVWRELSEISDQPVRTICLLRAARSASNASLIADARELIELAAPSAERLEEPTLRAEVWNRKAETLRECGETAQAEEVCRRALEFAESHECRRQEGIARGILAIIFRESGRTEKAESQYVEARAIFSTLGDTRLESVATGNLAVLHQMTDRGESARKLYREALKMSDQAGDVRYSAMLRGNIAILHHGDGEYQEAERVYREAMATHHRVGNRRSEATVLGNLAGLYRALGKLREAKDLYERALEMHRELDNRAMAGGHEAYYALCLLDMGLLDLARLHWRKGIDAIVATGDTIQLKRAANAMIDACEALSMRPLDMPQV